MNLKQFKDVLNNIPEKFDNHNILLYIDSHYSDLEWHGKYSNNSDFVIFTADHPNPYPHQKENCLWIANMTHRFTPKEIIFKDRIINK